MEIHIAFNSFVATKTKQALQLEIIKNKENNIQPLDLQNAKQQYAWLDVCQFVHQPYPKSDKSNQIWQKRIVHQW